MLKNPRLKYCFFSEFLDDENVLLMSGKNSALLSSRTFNMVLSEIQQNSMSVDELINKLDGKISPVIILYALDVLEKKGYITEAVPSLPQETNAYWNSQGIEVNSLIEILKEKTISLQTLGPLSQDVFMQAFSAIGIKTGESGVLKVIVTDDYERMEFRRYNQEAMDTKQPWMMIKPVGVDLWLGPIFLPGKTGCWECLKQRLTINHPINTFYKIQKKTEYNPPIPVAAILPSLQVAAGLAAIEIVKWLYFGKNERLEGKIVTFDTQSLTSHAHALVKRPQCKSCGNPDYNRREPKPIILKRKSSHCSTSSGGYREISLEDTIEKYKHHISPITGVAQKLEPYYSIKDTPVYNYSAGYNIAFRSKTLFWLNHVRSSNGGKGKTWSQAKAGALCEAIERYSCVYHGEEPYIINSLKEMGKDGIHPNACMNFSEKQYQNREEINRACSKFYFMVPIPFDESLKMHWTPVYSLSEQKFKYLPSCFCYAQYPAEDDYRLFSYPDSNGCAAGNSLEEAILQGFLELVERDSVALWWYNMLRKPEVDLLSFNEPYFFDLIEYYQSLDRRLYVLDLTADLQIPAFAAISHRINDNERENIIFGFGAHVDAKIAIERALVELNQILPIANVPGTNRTGKIYRTTDKTFVDWLNNATIKNQPYLQPLENVPVRKASDYPRLCDPNIYDSVMFCLDTAGKHGLEALVLDLTRPDIGLPVVKVIVPGLRHFWKRLAPGRLFDVPVKMGWLKKPLKDEELNPIELFI